MFFIICYHFVSFSLSLSHSLTPPTVLDSIKQGTVIKRNVSAFIKYSTEYCCARCAYFVLWSVLELFDCHFTWHFLVLYLCVCVCVSAHVLCLGVFSLLLLFSHFMGLLSIDCAVLREREIASHSQSVTLSLSLVQPPLLPLPLFFSPPLLSLFLFCLRGWPQLARHPGRAMPKGTPGSWQIVRCTRGSWGEVKRLGRVCGIHGILCFWKKQKQQTIWCIFIYFLSSMVLWHD